MKSCDICLKKNNVQYRVKSINYKKWIFCCKTCWVKVSNQKDYCYGGTRKS